MCTRAGLSPPRGGGCTLTQEEKRELARKLFEKLSEQDQVTYLVRLQRLLAEPESNPAAPVSAAQTTA